MSYGKQVAPPFLRPKSPFNPPHSWPRGKTPSGHKTQGGERRKGILITHLLSKNFPAPSPPPLQPKFPKFLSESPCCAALWQSTIYVRKHEKAAGFAPRREIRRWLWIPALYTTYSAVELFQGWRDCGSQEKKP